MIAKAEKSPNLLSVNERESGMWLSSNLKVLRPRRTEDVTLSLIVKQDEVTTPRSIIQSVLHPQAYWSCPQIFVPLFFTGVNIPSSPFLLIVLETWPNYRSCWCSSQTWFWLCSFIAKVGSYCNNSYSNSKLVIGGILKTSSCHTWKIRRPEVRQCVNIIWTVSKNKIYSWTKIIFLQNYHSITITVLIFYQGLR